MTETLARPSGVRYRGAVTRTTITTLACSIVALSGCLTLGTGTAPSEDDGEPTVEPGTYEVEGQTTENTCGVGSLALADSWSFDVVLKRKSKGGISWDVGNGPTPGSLEDDGDFSVESSFVQDMRTEEDSWKPPCSVKRSDVVKGTLAEVDEGADEDALGATFEGSMTFTFEPTEGSDCSDLVIGEERLAAQLPCVARYDLEGTAVEIEAEDEGVSE